MDPKETTPGTLADEARSLDAELEGRTEEKPAAPAEPVADKAAANEPVSVEREVGGIFAAVGAGLGNFFPSVKAVLTDERCLELGAAIAPVLAKWGLASHITGFAWRVELQAVMVVVPTVLAVREAIMHDLKPKRDKPAESPLGALPVDQAASSAPAVVAGALQPVERKAA